MLLTVRHGVGCLNVLTVNDVGKKTWSRVPFNNWFYVDIAGGEVTKKSIVSTSDVIKVENVELETLSGRRKLLKVTHKSDVTKRGTLNSYDTKIPNDLRWRIREGRVQGSLNRVVFLKQATSGMYQYVDCNFGKNCVRQGISSSDTLNSEFQDVHLLVFWEELEIASVGKLCPGLLRTCAVLYMRPMLNNWLKTEMYEFVDQIRYADTFITSDVQNSQEAVLLMKEIMIEGGLLDMILFNNTLTNTMIEDYNRPDIAMYSLFALMATTCSRAGVAINSLFANDGVKLQGGMVQPGIRGLHRNVKLFDFKSMYPAIILDYGLNYIKCDDTVATTKTESILYNMIKPLIDARNRVRDSPTEQHINKTLKRITNTIYGMFGAHANCHGLTYHALTNAITKVGRYLNTKSADFAKFKGLTVIFGDTDCIMVVGFTDSYTPEEFANEFNDVLRSEGHVFTTLNYESSIDNCLIYAAKWWCGIVGSKFVSKGPLGLLYCPAVQQAFSDTMHDIFSLNEVNLGRGRALEILKAHLDRWDGTITSKMATTLVNQTRYDATVYKDETIKMSKYEVLPVVDVIGDKTFTLKYFESWEGMVGIDFSRQKRTCLSVLSNKWFTAFANDGSRMDKVKENKRRKVEIPLNQLFNAEELFN